MALELAKNNPVYEDIASKFFEVLSPVILRIASSDTNSLALYLHRGCHDVQDR